MSIVYEVKITEIKFQHTCSEYHPNKLSDESRGVLAREAEKNAHKDPTTRIPRFWQNQYSLSYSFQSLSRNNVMRPVHA